MATRRESNTAQWAVVRVGKPPIQRFSSRFPAVVFLDALAWRRFRHLRSFQLDDSGTIEPVRKPNGQGVRIIARNPMPSAFEVLFPTTTMVSTSASPTTAIVPGSSTRQNKRCSANQYRVSRRRVGAWLANCDMPTESGHRSESRSRSTTSVTMPF